TFFIAAMIHSVDERLFNRLERVVEEAIRLGAVRTLDYKLPDSCASQVTQSILDHPVERATKGLLTELVAGRPFGEMHDVNLRIREELLRMLVEKHQPDVAREQILIRSVHQIHLPAQLHKIHLRRFIGKAAANPP